MLNEETLNRLNEIEHAAYRCVIDEHYFEIVTRNTKRDFWTVVQNALGDGVCLYWFHLFGNRDDHLHYSKFFNRPDVHAIGKEYSRESVKKRILSVIGYDDEQYEKFRDEVKYCRDKFVAHREVGAKGNYPNINICRLMAEELRVILSELIEKCNDRSPDDDKLFLWKHYYSSNSNKRLYKKCLILYNARMEDSSNFE